MAQVQREQRVQNLSVDDRDSVKPRELFDLICGTSTGGLIPLMLGRLERVSDFAHLSSFDSD